jgi:hypothetical protein
MCSQKVLLLNASNMDTHPVYPYAFIQVPAVAKQSGIQVICRDLLGIPPKSWEQTVQALIERFDPTMILITLRNTDSMTAQDYKRDASKKGARSSYFPVERTKELVSVIRLVSNLRITVGGFGFSVLPNEIMQYLRPDFGVFGGPDAFFAHFEDIQAGNLRDVENLLYFQDDQLISNPRVPYPPLADTEYTAQTIEEMMGFYSSFPSPGFKGAPVEIMRGCCHSCVFCSEPHVSGKKVRYRDLSAVMRDIEMLVGHGINQIYMISSELNPEGNGFVLKLADRIRSFNERQTEQQKVTWYGANYLLNFSIEEYERLHSSGFTGGWFEITALDDENARAMRTPYRNRNVLANLQTYAHSERTQLEPLQEREASHAEGTVSEEDSNRKEDAIEWVLFLGNPATTAKTIRNTLLVANREGLAQLFTDCSINTHIRVFDYEEPNEATWDITFSVTTDLERTHYQQLLPSFAFPSALLQEFGSEDEIELMFGHIAQTYLSNKYQETRDWHGFQKSTAASITRWIAKLSESEGACVPAHLGQITGRAANSAVQELFSESLQESEGLPKQVVDFLLSACLRAFPDFFKSLCLPRTVEELDRTTSYELAVAVFSQWDTEKGFVDELTIQTRSVLPEWNRDLLAFCAQAILYMFNILIRSKYRQLFISDGTTACEPG